MGLIGTNWAFELFATWFGLGLGGSGPGLDKVVSLCNDIGFDIERSVEDDSNTFIEVLKNLKKTVRNKSSYNSPVHDGCLHPEN